MAKTPTYADVKISIRYGDNKESVASEYRISEQNKGGPREFTPKELVQLIAEVAGRAFVGLGLEESFDELVGQLLEDPGDE